MRIDSKIQDVLTKSALFSEIKREDIPAMLSCLSARTNTFSKGSYLFSAGDPAPDVGLVLEGAVHIIKEDFWGNRSIIARIGPGELFAEAFSCAEIPSLPVSAAAVTDCTVLSINYRKIITVCSHACVFHTRLIHNMLHILALKNQMLMDKLGYLTKRTTREKLLSYLSAQAVQTGSSRFFIPFDRQELADFLCVERSAMSAELSRLKKEGLLDYRKNEFTLNQKPL